MTASVPLWTVGLPELLIILLIVMLLFGASQIPRLMRGMGQGIHEFKKGLNEGDQEKEKEASPAGEEKPKSGGDSPAH